MSVNYGRNLRYFVNREGRRCFGGISLWTAKSYRFQRPRMIRRVDSYVLKLIAVPLGLVLGIAAMLLLLERMLRLFDLVVNQGGPFTVVWRMLMNLVPHYMGLALPIAFFLGILIAFRGLSTSSELDALQSSGVGVSRLSLPVFYVAGLLLIFNLILVGYLQPYGRYAYRSLRFDLSSGALGASIREGEYTKISEELTLKVGNISDGGDTLSNILVYRDDGEGNIATLTAEEGSFRVVGQNRDLVLSLKNGVQLTKRADGDGRTILRFDSHDLVVELDEIEAFRDRGDSERELTLPELWQAGSAGVASTETGEVVSSRTIFSELNGRIVRSLSILILPLIAIPLAIVRRRSDGSFGTAFGILILLLYHKALEFGEAMSSEALLPVWAGVWVPFVLLLGAGAYMFQRAAYKVDAGLLPWLAEKWDEAEELVRSLIPARFRGEDEWVAQDEQAAE